MMFLFYFSFISCNFCFIWEVGLIWCIDTVSGAFSLWIGALSNSFFVSLSIFWLGSYFDLRISTSIFFIFYFFANHPLFNHLPVVGHVSFPVFCLFVCLLFFNLCFIVTISLMYPCLFFYLKVAWNLLYSTFHYGWRPGTCVVYSVPLVEFLYLFLVKDMWRDSDSSGYHYSHNNFIFLFFVWLSAVILVIDKACIFFFFSSVEIQSLDNMYRWEVPLGYSSSTLTFPCPPHLLNEGVSFTLKIL